MVGVAPPILDLTGQRFGRLIAFELAPERTSNGKARWICRCDCGAGTTVDARNLRSGSTLSCGCHRRAIGERTLTHGRTNTPEFRAWTQMLYRCLNVRCAHYRHYGGRGITVCARWMASFENFLADVGERPSADYSLDRKDNDGPYAPGNVRWATPTQQANNRRVNHRLTYDGKTMTISEWAAHIGISRESLRGRLKLGWSVEEAVTASASK
jgi:hypothetical protein